VDETVTEFAFNVRDNILSGSASILIVRFMLYIAYMLTSFLDRDLGTIADPGLPLLPSYVCAYLLILLFILQ